VPADADFFDRGGHPTLAMRVIARLREDGPAGLALRDLFRSPSVARLAARLDELALGAPPLPEWWQSELAATAEA
jgi:hypothetical protein